MNNESSQSNVAMGDCGCIDPTSSIQKESISKLREQYCTDMFDLKGKVVKLEVRKESLDQLITDKQCLFVWTERNYRIYRNLGFQTSAELLQTSDSIKEGVKNYLNTNKTLAESLKKLVEAAADISVKTKDLREMARKLKDARADECNCSQMIELTGEVTGNCKGSKPDPRPAPCDARSVNHILDRLSEMPEYLCEDAKTIYNASADVSGIQKFSNITTLDPLQAGLSDKIKNFDKNLQEIIKRGDADVKTSLADLIKAKQDLAKTDVELYSTRSDFEGVKKAVAFFCCQPCVCVPLTKTNIEKRLDGCADEICKICTNVKITACPPLPPKKDQ
jgi:hypothetical protein